MGRFAKGFFRNILFPLLAFWAFALFIKFTPFFKEVDTDSMGEDSVDGLISYYKTFAPVQMLIAVLTQWIIVMPLWGSILAKGKRAILIFSLMLLACLLAAFGIAYIIWDPVTGTRHLMHIFMFMAGVQVFYWVINFTLLYLLDRNRFRQPVAAAEDKGTEE